MGASVEMRWLTAYASQPYAYLQPMPTRQAGGWQDKQMWQCFQGTSQRQKGPPPGGH